MSSECTLVLNVTAGISLFLVGYVIGIGVPSFDWSIFIWAFLSGAILGIPHG